MSSTIQLPKTMKAFVAGETPGTATVQDVPVPTLDDNEVLIKVEYATQNPTDWKHEAFFTEKDGIFGMDYAGTVVRLGNNLAQGLAIGDKVAGWVHGGLWANKGSFAQYCKQESDLLFKVPAGFDLKEGPQYGTAWTTACQALIHSQHREFPPQQVAVNTWYLVYGASSSVGLFAVQLAKAMGYKVIAVCGSHNEQLVRSYGADEVVDYHDAEKAKSEIQRITGGVTLGMDTVSDDALDIALGGFKKGEKGQLTTILPVSEEAQASHPNIEKTFIVAYTMMGKGFHSPMVGGYLPAVKEDRAFLVETYRRTPELITKYKFKANPIHDQGGLEDVRAGFELHKAGKISAKKITYTIV